MSNVDNNIKEELSEELLHISEQLQSDIDSVEAQHKSEIKEDFDNLRREQERAKTILGTAASALKSFSTQPMQVVEKTASGWMENASSAVHELTDPEIRKKREQHKKEQKACEKAEREEQKQAKDAEEKRQREAAAKRAAEVDAKRIPIWMKIFGVLGVIGFITNIPDMASSITDLALMVADGSLAMHGATTMTITIVNLVVLLSLAVSFAFLGIRLIRNKRRYGAELCYTLYLLILAGFVCSLMLYGTTWQLIPYLGAFIITVAIQTFLDPSLRDERKLQRRLRAREDLAAAENGTLGRDPSGKGYIKLNFFHLFWVFVIGSIFGLVCEELFHVLLVAPGDWQNRSSLLYLPMSTLYGCAAVILTIALNNLYKSSPALTLVVSAIVSMALESATFYIMKFAWGTEAWRYSNPDFIPLLGGSTCVVYGVMFGVMGVFFLRVCLPLLLRIINLIPWNLRYAVTTIAAIVVFVDIGMTMIALDCWQERVSGHEPDTPVAELCAEYYDNEWMEQHFQTMKIVPRNAIMDTASENNDW